MQDLYRSRVSEYLKGGDSGPDPGKRVKDGKWEEGHLLKKRESRSAESSQYMKETIWKKWNGRQRKLSSNRKTG